MKMTGAQRVETGPQDYDSALKAECAACYADPLRFVRVMYRWPFGGLSGPVPWQVDVLEELGAAVRDRGYDPDTGASVKPIRKAISSGNSCGKSALVAWLVNWLMSTRIDTRGTVTANTQDQLQLKTWAAVREWTKRCRTAHWFVINTDIMYRIGQRATWACAPLSCSPDNADAYQGQHARGSTSWYVFDEASGILPPIWDAAEGGLTDEPLILVSGNPLRASGRFYEACFGSGRDRWHPTIVDARTSPIGNQALIQEWLEQHGEDGDFFRVHVRGLPPRASDLQFIGQELVYAAQQREVVSFDDVPLIAGVDFSGGGNAWNVVRFRRGFDARSLPPIRVPGSATRTDRSAFLSVLAELLGDRTSGKKLAAMFCDSAYGAPYVVLLRNMGYTNVFEVNFGSTVSPDEAHCANMRAYMWRASKEWLPYGSIPPDDSRLADDACGPGHHLDSRNRLVIESKESMRKRGVPSPDDWDAHVLTFAAPINARKNANRKATRPKRFAGRTMPGGSNKWTH